MVSDKLGAIHISTWSIFESFARSLVVEWVNQDPNRALSLLASTELKDFFGKKAVDIQIIGDHGFDLSRSMGAVLFKDRRLDSLANIRSTMKALFKELNVNAALGDQLWLLNQRRHLFVHRRGVVDAAYLDVTGDKQPIGARMKLTWDDAKQHLWAVQSEVVLVYRPVYSLVKMDQGFI